MYCSTLPILARAITILRSQLFRWKRWNVYAIWFIKAPTVNWCAWRIQRLMGLCVVCERTSKYRMNSRSKWLWKLNWKMHSIAFVSHSQRYKYPLWPAVFRYEIAVFNNGTHTRCTIQSAWRLPRSNLSGRNPWSYYQGTNQRTIRTQAANWSTSRLTRGNTESAIQYYGAEWNVGGDRRRGRDPISTCGRCTTRFVVVPGNK